jgi:MFS family permease
VLSFPISLFPVINAERFHDSPRTLGLFLTAIAVGGVLAATLSGTFTRLARPGMVMLSGAALWGLALAGFAVVSNPWIGLSLLVFAGIGDTLSAVSRSTIVLLHTPDALRGRVAAAEQIVGQAGPDVGNMRAGVLAGATSGTVSLLTGGLMCVSAVILVALFRPELRRSAAGLRTTDLRVHSEVIERARKDRHHSGSGLCAGLGGAAEVVALPGRQYADEQPDDQDHRSDA